MKIIILEREEKSHIKAIIVFNHKKLYSKGKNEGIRYKIKEVLWHYHPPYKRTAKTTKYYTEIGFKKEAYPEFYFNCYKDKKYRQNEV
jgi:hypothetical protein